MNLYPIGNLYQFIKSNQPSTIEWTAEDLERFVLEDERLHLVRCNSDENLYFIIEWMKYESSLLWIVVGKRHSCRYRYDIDQEKSRVVYRPFEVVPERRGGGVVNDPDLGGDGLAPYNDSLINLLLARPGKEVVIELPEPVAVVVRKHQGYPGGKAIAFISEADAIRSGEM